MIKDTLTFDEAVEVADAIVAAYTRDRHKTGTGVYRAGVEAVIGAVARRIHANPAGVQMRETVGPFTRYVEAGFQGFTLAELHVLNRYRKRAM
ncbi:hypothetical protein [Corynebacterium phoceense]